MDIGAEVLDYSESDGEGGPSRQELSGRLPSTESREVDQQLSDTGEDFTDENLPSDSPREQIGDESDRESNPEEGDFPTFPQETGSPGSVARDEEDITDSDENKDVASDDGIEDVTMDEEDNDGVTSDNEGRVGGGGRGGNDDGIDDISDAESLPEATGDDSTAPAMAVSEPEQQSTGPRVEEEETEESGRMVEGGDAGSDKDRSPDMAATTPPPPAAPTTTVTNMADLFASDDDEEEQEKDREEVAAVERESDPVGDSIDDDAPPAKRKRVDFQSNSSDEDSDTDLDRVSRKQQHSPLSEIVEVGEMGLQEEEVGLPEGEEEGEPRSGAEDEEGEESLAAELADLTEGRGDGTTPPPSQMVEEDEDEDVVDNTPGPSQEIQGLSDFDLMLEKKRAKARRSRKKRGGDIAITSHDDVTVSLIERMRAAAEEDKRLNLAQKAATKKLAMLPLVANSLKKPEIAVRFIDIGGLESVSDWLTPLPDHSLPNQKIRETLLDLLRSFPSSSMDSYTLKKSRVGKATMLLYRHPKELRKNKEKAGKLIQEWSRPIFGLTSDFKNLSRDEREERDYAHITPTARRRLSSTEDQKKTGMEMDSALKPGDTGWIGRARVPRPSHKDYIVRPKWNTEVEQPRGSGKKNLNRYDKQVLKFKERKRAKGSSHAVKVNVAGNKMAV